MEATLLRPDSTGQLNGTVLPEVPSKRTSHPASMGPWEIGVGILAVLGWTVLLTAGIVVGTEPFRRELGDPTKLTPARLLESAAVVILCYTVTNLVLLCCLSSYLGAMGRRARICGNERNGRWHSGPSDYVAAVLRGFFVYLVLLSGLVLFTGVTGKSFTNPGQFEYSQLAGVCSVFSFLMGYSPRLFGKLCARLTALAQDGSDDEEREKK